MFLNLRRTLVAIAIGAAGFAGAFALGRVSAPNSAPATHQPSRREPTLPTASAVSAAASAAAAAASSSATRHDIPRLKCFGDRASLSRRRTASLPLPLDVGAGGSMEGIDRLSITD